MLIISNVFRCSFILLSISEFCRATLGTRVIPSYEAAQGFLLTQLIILWSGKCFDKGILVTL